MYAQQIALWNSSGQEIACTELAGWSQGSVSLEAYGLQIGQVYYISVDHKNSAGTFSMCKTNLSLTWKGVVSSDWNNVNNWDPNRIPTNMDNILIPNSSTTNFDPLINSTANCNALTIESGGLLTVAAGGALTALGNFINNGTFLLASPTDNGMSGSFIDNGNISGTGIVQVERYIISNEFKYVSAPIIGGNAHSGLFTSFGSSFNANFYTYNEGYDLDDNPSTAPAGEYNDNLLSYAWVFVQELASDPNVMMQPTKGYSFYTDIDGKITYRADLSLGDKLNTNNQSVTGLTSTNNDPMPLNSRPYDGWNLVGNPYPSCIDWDLIKNGLTNVDDAIYVWDKTQYATYVNGISGGSGAQNNFIAPMQGFSVHVNANNAGFVLNNSHRAHSASTKYKNAENNLVSKQLISLRLSANGKSDIAVVYFEPDATEEFDGSYDAFRMFSRDNDPANSKNKGVPHLFTITPNKKALSINALPDALIGETTIPLGIRLGTNAFPFD